MEIHERRVLTTRINDDIEVVIFEDDQSVEMRSRSESSVILNNDDAYKVFTTLQSVLFPNVPLIESLNV
jgi:hypothetical protein